MKLKADQAIASQLTAPTLNFEAPVGQDLVTERVTLYGKYKVVDTGIEAGENVEGWINRFKLKVVVSNTEDGDNKEVLIFDIRSDEMSSFLQAIARDEPINKNDLLPTTNEDQYFYFSFENHIDWALVESAELVLELQAATAEWAGASAMTAEFWVDLEEAAVDDDEPAYVEARPRYYKAASTEHTVKFVDFKCYGGDYSLGAGHASKVQLDESEGQPVFLAEDPIHNLPSMARAYEGYDAVPTADLPSKGKLPPMLVFPTPTRVFKCTPSESAALTFYPLLIIGQAPAGILDSLLG